MTREEILDLCRRAPDLGAVKHEDYADYIVVLESRSRVDDEWQPAENAYMAVDGKLAMANEDHRKQGKRLDFAEPKVLLDNEDQLTLEVTATSEIYGMRHGIATSRKKVGTFAEREFPWEVAETSAIGRALSSMGYGLLPGAGLASAEDMIRATTPASTSYAKDNARRPATSNNPMTVNQRAKLIEMYLERHDGTESEAVQGLDAQFQTAFSHPFNQATFEEASKMITQMSAQRVERVKK
ncbi:MAG: hypothetical protein HZB51_25510 [Chloroflexi bacterium]|nr:hypothetical protein [Chloroflexota bacterium]